MPGCLLHVSGEEFAVDEFLAASTFKPYRVHRRGEPKGKADHIHEDSGFSVDVSDVDGELDSEIEDAVRFLRFHESELTRLATFSGIQDRRLDFGYYRRNVFMQSEYLPAELLKLAGTLGISIELSLYPQPENAEATDHVA